MGDLVRTGQDGTADQTQQRVPARSGDGQPQAADEPSPRLPAQREAHGLEAVPQGRRTPLVARRHLRQAFTEGPTHTGRIATVKAPGMQVQPDGEVPQGQIGKHTRKAAMRPMGALTTIGARRGPPGGRHLACDLLLPQCHGVQVQRSPMGEDSEEEQRAAHKAPPRKWQKWQGMMQAVGPDVLPSHATCGGTSFGQEP